MNNVRIKKEPGTESAYGEQNEQQKKKAQTPVQESRQINLQRIQARKQQVQFLNYTFN